MDGLHYALALWVSTFEAQHPQLFHHLDMIIDRGYSCLVSTPVGLCEFACFLRVEEVRNAPYAPDRSTQCRETGLIFLIRDKLLFVQLSLHVALYSAFPRR